MKKEIMIIPANPRNPIDKIPLITNEMKARCIGEFSWDEQADYYDENGNVIEHTATRVVPWDLCKQIYKTMARIASASMVKK